ncbi:MULTISPECIES: hypothetical protein [Enterococcus]|jgi:hypothetical protein|nr:hypothetical protein [Enterococcus faecalis]ARV04157.1 hypothetical protein A6B47_09965 [Enterococcus faecalis]EEU91629.1 predicted protein [Enterococcus faecalis T11]EGO2709905.1 hypothetical protein [Enterococcus faecalis]EHK9410082.1 hypothetical protein [Enterococcus faecalis]EHV2898453.1 hypothetical protein [Enterococcus faecalis]
MAKKQINKGNQLEFRAKRLLFYMGYYAVHNILIKSSNDIIFEEITDLDVIGLKYTSDFRSNRVWVDCKSGRIKTMERLTWINGIKNYLNIDEVLFIATSKKAAVDYASQLDIQIFDQKIFAEVEKRFNINSDKWYGSWNPEVMLNISQEFKSIEISGIDIKKIASFINADYWIYDSFTGLKKSITAIRQLAKIPYDVLEKDQKTAYRWAIYQLIILLTDSILKVNREVFYLEKKKREEYINQKLIASDIPINRRNEIFESAAYLISQKLKSSDPNLVTPLNVNVSPPNYAEALNSVVERLINAPKYAEDILRTMDLLFMEFDLLEKPLDEDIVNSLLPSYKDNVFGIKIILHFVVGSTDIDKTLFKLLS